MLGSPAWCRLVPAGRGVRELRAASGLHSASVVHRIFDLCAVSPSPSAGAVNSIVYDFLVHRIFDLCAVSPSPYAGAVYSISDFLCSYDLPQRLAT